MFHNNRKDGGVNMANKLVATINGKEIYSDKLVNSIVNTRVAFTDGSWCDVATGEVVNRGSGYINIGAPSRNDGEKATFGQKAYNATALDVQDVEADVDIQPINGLEMRVTINGLKSAVEDVDVRLQDNTVVMRGKQNGGTHVRGANVIISGSGGSISVGGSVVSIGGRRIVAGHSTVVMSGAGESDTKVTVGIPKGSAVKVVGVQGKVIIGDTDGALHASVLGCDNIKAGKVRDATLSVRGSGNIYVDAVNGNLSMNIKGSGNILVRGGSVGVLNANIMGSGDARFNGEAVDANLSVMGSGDIDVASVKNKPNKTVMGHGDINVGNW